MSVAGVVDFCSEFREGLKPIFFVLAKNIELLRQEVYNLKTAQSTKHPLEDIDMTAYITNAEVKEMLEQKDAYIDTLEKRLAAFEAKCPNIE